MTKLLLCLAAAALVSACFPAAAGDGASRRPAIVLAAFGTSEPDALGAIQNIVSRVEAAFPDYDVHLAFTSNIIRGIWHRRAGDDGFRADHPGIHDAIYGVGNVLTVLARIQEDGPRPVLVQSLHVTDGSEYNDMAALVGLLGRYRAANPARSPFPAMEVGEPALGVGDGGEARLKRAVAALAPLVHKARDRNAALVLMGHGNEHLNQGVFARLEAAMRDAYGRHTYIGTVEARPFADDIAGAMAASGDAPEKVLLAPLMVVAGDHAKNDMAGDEDDSWASVFAGHGYEVETHLVGLGALDSWADIYVEHLREAEGRLRAAGR